MVNVWKVLAIVFMTLFVIETLVVVLVYNIGVKSIESEEKCRDVVCADSSYDSYNYDMYGDVCYCIGDGEVLKVVDMNG